MSIYLNLILFVLLSPIISYFIFEIIDPSLYSSSRNFEFEDITSNYIRFLESDKYKKKNSFCVWKISGRGWGKTSLTFSEINIILKDNPKRFVQFLKAPPELIEKVNKVCPEDLKGRFETIFKTRDIKPNSLLVIDEGLLGVNAKEALKVEMRNFTKFLSKSRHPNIICQVNSVNLNILSEFRDMIDIMIYKHLPINFIKNNKDRDPFLIEHMGKISHLREWQGLLVSNYKGFEKVGEISIKYEEYCPWFNDDISRYHKDTSPDVSYDENIRIQNINKKIAREIINKIGDTFKNKRDYDLFEAWLCDSYPDIHYDYKTQLPMIFKFYRYFLKEDEINGIDDTPDPIPFEFKEKESFSDFVRRVIPEDKIARVAEGLARGDPYRTIDDNHNDILYHFVRTTSKWLRSEANTQYGLGYLFEKWMAFNLGVPEEETQKLGGNQNGPDLDHNNQIWTFKFRISKREKSYKFRQSIDFTPEYNLAKKRGSKYKLGFMDPKWSLKVQIIEIDPYLDPEEIIVKEPKRTIKLII